MSGRGVSILLLATLLAAVVAGCTAPREAGAESKTAESSMPAADQALHSGLGGLYATEGAKGWSNGDDDVSLLLTMSAPDGTLFGQVNAAIKGSSDECLFDMWIDPKAAEEAYGTESQPTPDADDASGDVMVDALENLGPFGDGDRFRMGFGVQGDVYLFAMGTDAYLFRDVVRDEDATCAPDLDDDNETSGDPEDASGDGLDKAMGPPDTLDAMGLFLEEEGASNWTIEPSTWEDHPAYLVRVQFDNQTIHGDGSFWLRQDDLFLMHAELDMTGYHDGTTLDVIDPNDAQDPQEFRMLMTLDMDTGDDVAVTMPDDAIRFAFDPTVDKDTQPSRIEGTIDAEHSMERPLDELELHVVTAAPAMFSGPEVKSTHARFDISAGSGTDGDFTFTFSDNDGDGLVSAGDSYVVTSHGALSFREGTASFGGETEDMVTVLFFDEWAGAYEGTPAPSLALVVLGLVGLAFVLGRRR